MEELQKTQEGDDRRKAGVQQPVEDPDASKLPVSGEDGTARR